MTGIEWSNFLPAAVLVSLVPGANQILSIQHGAQHGIRSALSGLVGRFTALTNPKALLLFAAFVPQFVAIRDAAHLSVAGIAYIGVEAVTASGCIVVGQRLGQLLHDAFARRRLDRTSSAAYLGLAGWLGLERRP